MDSIILTILFDGQFWLGLFERQSGDRYAVHRHVFGPEPTDAELAQFINQEFHRLAFSRPAGSTEKLRRVRGFKKRLRLAKQALAKHGLGTKAQLALKQQQEANKTEKKVESRAARELAAQLKFEQKRLKAKKKHRGK